MGQGALFEEGTVPERRTMIVSMLGSGTDIKARTAAGAADDIKIESIWMISDMDMTGTLLLITIHNSWYVSEPWNLWKRHDRNHKKKITCHTVGSIYHNLEGVSNAEAKTDG